MRERFETENEFGSGVVKSWASIVDENALDQAKAISRVPIVDEHLALMPDAHFGFGPPVGSALKTRGAVMPYAVGVDIGCGMMAVRTSLERGALAMHERRILENIRELIPSGLGTSHHAPLPQAEEFVADEGLPPGIQPDSRLANKRGLLPAQFQSLRGRLRIQFGTLGSGNHFVEVCEDREERVWLLLHSGSRGIGNVLATAHVNAARAFCDENGIAIESNEFAYVVEGSRQFRDYVADMLWAQRYAYMQREAMMDNLIIAVEREVGSFEVLRAVPGVGDERINCHHNYAEEIEPGLWLTRKGAIDASVGRLGIIPGSMGAATYIVRGKGNAESHYTSPHDAGRLGARGRPARKNKPATGAFAALSIEDFRAQMEGKTWLDRDAEALLDEAPGAYKPIETVIADSAGLIEPVTVLSQFINYKGL